ncbi:hypothetical protein M441DRAFT_433105 [Trichoderma asperellum CBS 433.97]|uniref:Uncharacterized protein n=1 Tax=Trichoderma asperellum (strain ATCC 204424 / CBS 433.97 / NBRC 101777) TaxID=1042311 RepID=A0A2T3Z2V0_TRIA4|nr:hypothetical protein M441DRAFT_433105 [Trichoderma asperellum CBS 433.97]PTB39122.1 hypothetical protein M441DRAFT_433105 [Trichoderma asperellum CBS 433.97]
MNCGVLRSSFFQFIQAQAQPPLSGRKPRKYTCCLGAKKELQHGWPTKKEQNPPLVADNRNHDAVDGRYGRHQVAGTLPLFCLLWQACVLALFFFFFFFFPSPRLTWNNIPRKTAWIIKRKKKKKNGTRPGCTKSWPNACVHVTVEQNSSAVGDSFLLASSWLLPID